ncbi:MAG: endonuclease III [Proteobacteria bacterium]|nr:endonuclease III [Pseudomonadota bacterium]
MKIDEIDRAVEILREEYKTFPVPYVTEVAAEKKRSPYKVLVSCILSLRTKDSTTREASERLFKIAPTPERLARLEVEVIERAIYPAGFYRVKAGTLKEVGRVLVEERGSKVPDTIEGLLELKGVGRKTANLVVTMGYNKPGICVDVHVHRITNRWGYVRTKSPDSTEMALRKKLPEKHWADINDLLVAYGQNLCRPVSPYCSECKLYGMCNRVGVKKRR